MIDEPTANWIRANVDSNVLRVRRVLKVLPYGMQTPLVVSELLAPEGPSSILKDEHIIAYESALEHFMAGEWAESFRWLHQVPAEDRVKDYLFAYIAQHRRTPPANWHGIIELPSK